MYLGANFLKEEISSAIIFFIAMLVISSIAFFKNFFKLEKKYVSNITGFYTFFVFFIFFIVSAIVTILYSILQKRFMLPVKISFSIMLNFISSLVVLFSLYIYCFVLKKNITNSLIKQKKEKTFFKDVKIGIISWIIVFPIVSFFSSMVNILIYLFYKIPKLPDQIAVNIIKASFDSPINFAILLISIIVIAPILEEFLFRAVLFNYFKKYFSRFLAITFSSLIFALIHYSQAQKLANITILSSLFILGCFLCFLYEKQRSITAPIFLHATFNLISILNLIFIRGI
jgi:CAAX protease family protein